MTRHPTLQETAYSTGPRLGGLSAAIQLKIADHYRWQIAALAEGIGEEVQPVSHAERFGELFRVVPGLAELILGRFSRWKT